MRLEGWALAALLAITSCAHSPPHVPAMPVADTGQPDGVSRAVHFFQHLQALNKEELKVEYDRVARDFAHSPTIENRIALILLLTYPRADFRDLNAALDLIDDYLANADPGTVTDFIWLLEANVQTQRAYEERIRTADVRSAQLQQQLNALKSIERAIHARELPE